jgi:GTP-binding protein Era
VSEIIREKIFEMYKQEIPYSCEVIIEDYKDGETSRGEKIARIRAVIYVDRDTQKPIVIGRNGEMLKKLGSAARANIEKFIESKAFLEITVKVRDNWRNDERTLKYLGYE